MHERWRRPESLLRVIVSADGNNTRVFCKGSFVSTTRATKQKQSIGRHEHHVRLLMMPLSCPLCRFVGGCRVHPREGEEGREEVGRKPIWPWRMEHSDSRSTGLVTQSCIPGVLSKLGRGWQGWGAGERRVQWLCAFKYNIDFSIWLLISIWFSIECKCILLPLEPTHR